MSLTPLRRPQGLSSLYPRSAARGMNDIHLFVIGKAHNTIFGVLSNTQEEGCKCPFWGFGEPWNSGEFQNCL